MLRTLFVLVALLMAFHSGAQGQHIIRMVHTSGAKWHRLMMPSVQKELKLTDEQKSKTQKLVRDYQEGMQFSLQSDGATSPEEIRESFERKQQETEKEFQPKFAKLLTEEQIARLDQIELQLGGADVFERADVLKKLELTAEQKSKVQTLLETFHQRMEELMNEVAPEQTEEGVIVKNLRGNKEMEQAMRKAKEDILALLTAKQKKTWESMVGKEFKPDPKLDVPPSPR